MIFKLFYKTLNDWIAPLYESRNINLDIEDGEINVKKSIENIIVSIFPVNELENWNKFYLKEINLLI